jgi:hypothetical protein
MAAAREHVFHFANVESMRHGLLPPPR